MHVCSLSSALHIHHSPHNHCHLFALFHCIPSIREELLSAHVSSFLTVSFNVSSNHCHQQSKVLSSFVHSILGIPLIQGSAEIETGNKFELFKKLPSVKELANGFIPYMDTFS